MVNLKGLKSKGYKSSKKSVMWSRPQISGVCLKVLTITPKKPNSAKRKVAKVLLSNKKLVRAYIVGEGSNLETHNIVLVRGGRVQDCIGIKRKVVRGKYDMRGVEGRSTSRSLYGVKKVC